MGVRRENAEVAGVVGARRGEEPRRIRCDTPQAPSPESARQTGQIRVRSRTLMSSPGSGGESRQGVGARVERARPRYHGANTDRAVATDRLRALTPGRTPVFGGLT